MFGENLSVCIVVYTFIPPALERRMAPVIMVVAFVIKDQLADEIR